MTGSATPANSRQPAPVGAPADGSSSASLAFSTSEIKQLWWFFDGAIMTPSTRDHLWRARGFCSRHTWAHTVTEFELRVVPLSSAILFNDLLGRMSGELRRRLPLHGRRHQLEAHDSCLTCDYLALTSTAGDPRFAEKTSRVNRRQRFTNALLETEPVWSARTCPTCLGGQGPTCRLHLLHDGDAAAVTVGDHELADQLDEVRDRLTRYVKSLTWNGPTASPEENAAWVEVIAWFAGWSYPDTALRGASVSTATDRGARWPE